MKELTASALRRSRSKTLEQGSCACCGEHKVIAELHHVLSLEECAEYANYRMLDYAEIPMVWLCPNCHSYLHAVFKALKGRGRIRSMDVLRAAMSDRQWGFVMDMWGLKMDVLRRSIRDRGHNDLLKP